jgi:uracil-DNA glycosylase family 4
LEPHAVLQKIADETRNCTKCGLQFSRKNAVPGAGPHDAEIMFIGEGPGFHENEQGLPFVGAAGRFLDELLEGIGIRRDQVFITNVVKCRPPSNRDPMAEELAACNGYLERQIQAINPKVIVTLGRFSMQKYMPNAKISQVHGQGLRVKGRLVVPFYHPAAALHQPSLRSAVEADFAKLPEWIKKAGDVPEYEEPPSEDEDKQAPEQLSFF